MHGWLPAGDYDTVKEAFTFFQKLENPGFGEFRLDGSVNKLRIMTIWATEVASYGIDDAGNLSRVVDERAFFQAAENHTAESADVFVSAFSRTGSLAHVSCSNIRPGT